MRRLTLDAIRGLICGGFALWVFSAVFSASAQQIATSMNLNTCSIHYPDSERSLVFCAFVFLCFCVFFFQVFVLVSIFACVLCCVCVL